MVACDPADSGHGWRERPAVLFEIVSEDTRRTDEREKRMAYRQLETLQAYVRLEQSRPELVVESRANDGWRTERFTGLDALVQLAEPALTLRLAEVYERLKFPAAGAAS
jgi:Uma2 family endonuclease